MSDTQPGDANQAPAHAPQPYRCSVCGGNGLVVNGFYLGTGPYRLTAGTNPGPCRSCSGTGVVWN